MNRKRRAKSAKKSRRGESILKSALHGKHVLVIVIDVRLEVGACSESASILGAHLVGTSTLFRAYTKSLTNQTNSSVE